MNIDVVPDITMRGQSDPYGRPTTPRPATVGQLATRLRVLAGRPTDWSALVRLDPARPIRTILDHSTEAGRGVDLWLNSWPPGHRADLADEHDAEVSTLIAGDLVEVTIGPDGVTERPLRSGRIHVRGRLSQRRPSRVLHNIGSTHAITLHARPR
jgi:hypothetical protein